MKQRNRSSAYARHLFDFTAIPVRTTPAIFAHRGASRLHRENTLPAFTAAIEMGVDGIEIDVRRTRDGVLVVHHNARPCRSSQRIADLDYGDLLVLANRWAYHVPTLEETLRLCAGRAALDLELKESGYERDVVKLANRHYSLRHVAFTSFQGRTVTAIRKAAPSATVGLIVGLIAPGTLQAQLRGGIFARRLERLGADFVAPHRRLVTRALSDVMSRLDFPVVAWTANTPASARRLVRRGVAILISDVPDRIASVVRGAASR